MPLFSLHRKKKGSDAGGHENNEDSAATVAVNQPESTQNSRDAVSARPNSRGDLPERRGSHHHQHTHKHHEGKEQSTKAEEGKEQEKVAVDPDALTKEDVRRLFDGAPHVSWFVLVVQFIFICSCCCELSWVGVALARCWSCLLLLFPDVALAWGWSLRVLHLLGITVARISYFKSSSLPVDSTVPLHKSEIPLSLSSRPSQCPQTSGDLMTVHIQRLRQRHALNNRALISVIKVTAPV